MLPQFHSPAVCAAACKSTSAASPSAPVVPSYTLQLSSGS